MKSIEKTIAGSGMLISGTLMLLVTLFNLAEIAGELVVPDGYLPLFWISVLVMIVGLVFIYSVFKPKDHWLF